MIVREPTDADLVHVVLKMRVQSAEEFFATSIEKNRDVIAYEFRRQRARFLVLRALVDTDDRAAAVIGLDWTGPGRASIMFLATDRFPAIMVPAHRWWRKQFMPGVMSQFRRVEFTGSPENTPSGRWLASVGFTCEGPAPAYGENGEDFAHWGWVNPAWRRVRSTVDGQPAVVTSPPIEDPQGALGSSHV